MTGSFAVNARCLILDTDSLHIGGSTRSVGVWRLIFDAMRCGKLNWIYAFNIVSYIVMNIIS